MAAPLLLDLVWPIFVLAGWERVLVEPGNTAFTPLAFVHYPLSHSLTSAIGLALAMAVGYWAAARYLRGATVVGLAVASHWFLDAVVHRPDLPLYPGSFVRIGFGLWNSIAGTLIVEGLLFLVGVWVYVATTRPRNGKGRYGMWCFVGLVTALYIANLTGPPPPGEREVALVSLAGWLFPLWAAWFDKHRVVKEHVALGGQRTNTTMLL